MRQCYSRKTASANHLERCELSVEVALDADLREGVLPDLQLAFGFSPEITILHVLDESDAELELWCRLVAFRENHVANQVQLDDAADLVFFRRLLMRPAIPCNRADASQSPRSVFVSIYSWLC